MNSYLATEKKYAVASDGIVRLNDEAVGLIRYLDPGKLCFMPRKTYAIWEITTCKNAGEIIRRINCALQLDYDKEEVLLLELPAYACANYNALMIFQNELNAKILLIKAERLIESEDF